MCVGDGGGLLKSWRSIHALTSCFISVSGLIKTVCIFCKMGYKAVKTADNIHN